MKSIFSIFLFFTLAIAPTAKAARDIILIENSASPNEGEMLLNIMEKKFNVPLELITFKTTKNCSKSSEAIMHLCLNSRGELDVIKVNRFVMKNSFGAFFEL